MNGEPGIGRKELFVLESEGSILGPYAFFEAVRILTKYGFVKAKKGRVWANSKELVSIVPWEESELSKILEKCVNQ
jgi:hypothetical protein